MKRREIRGEGGEEREAKLLSEEGPEAEEEDDEEEVEEEERGERAEGAREGEPADGEGAGVGAGKPTRSTGSRTCSMANMLTGCALYRVLVIIAPFHAVTISTCPFRKVTLSTYFPPELYVAKVLVTLSLVFCRSAKDSQLLSAWYSNRASTCFSDKPFNSVAVGSAVKALFFGANIVIPTSVEFACFWNFSPTPDEPKSPTKVAKSPADTRTPVMFTGKGAGAGAGVGVGDAAVR